MCLKAKKRYGFERNVVQENGYCYNLLTVWLSLQNVYLNLYYYSGLFLAMAILDQTNYNPEIDPML